MMMTRVLALVIALTLAGAAGADARQPHGGGPGGPGGGGGGGGRGGGGAPPAGPAQGGSRPEPMQAGPMRAAPMQAAPRSGFNLSRDTGPMNRPQAEPRAAAAMPAMAARSSSDNRQPAPGAYRSLSGGVRPPTSGGRPPAPPPGGWPHAHPSGFVVANPRYRGGAWGWNAGARWVGYSNYWGDGFWGPFALGSLSDQYAAGGQSEALPYYQVADSTPGAQLLANYDLTQTPCGSSELVVLYGPNGGTICAYPNATVGPGNYTIDESSLTITASS